MAEGLRSISIDVKASVPRSMGLRYRIVSVLLRLAERISHTKITVEVEQGNGR